MIYLNNVLRFLENYDRYIRKNVSFFQTKVISFEEELGTVKVISKSSL